jgi:hypothetical protein
MKFRTLMCVTAITFFTALTTSARLSAQASTFTVLHAFTGLSDGRNPTANLVRDAAGNLYGTANGGAGLACGGGGCGVVFKLGATGKETVLHRFTGADGVTPPGRIGPGRGWQPVWHYRVGRPLRRRSRP